MNTRNDLTPGELEQLIDRVFPPSPTDTALAVLIDLPDDRITDRAEWRERREIARRWVGALRTTDLARRLDIDLVAYPNAGGNNADLPETAWILEDTDPLPATVEGTGALSPTSMRDVLHSYSLLIALTELSATAPLKVAGPAAGFRAATMPGFSPAMLPALRLDYAEINNRVHYLKSLLDPSESARLILEVRGGESHTLELDLRHRLAHASGGVFPDRGTAGNLPSGESYIVPYEGELAGDPSLSRGELPIQIEGDVMVLEVEGNRVVAVRGDGPAAERERRHFSQEPAYTNIAELGLGVLADFGLAPIGEILLDEKLGLHVAFGRSDHFGGAVGPEDFSSPQAVVHTDRVYLPDLQPDIEIRSVSLDGPEGFAELIRDGEWAVRW